jgi:putative transposase
MDFVHDQLATGKKIRVLTVVDTFSRFVPVLDARFKYRGEDVVQTLERVCAKTGYPTTIRVDQGSELISRDLDLWAYAHGVTLDFSRPGTPTDNAFIEAFNGRFRAECLNTYWFLNLADAREKLEDWSKYYNEERPHGAKGPDSVAESLWRNQPAIVTKPENSTFRRSRKWSRISRKLHILVDTLGLLLNVAVHSADIQDRDGAALVLNQRTRRLFPFIERIYADGGYQGPRVRATAARTGTWKVEIVKRSDIAKGFIVLPKRWIVERTFAWISRCRRLSRDFERYARTVAAFVRPAMIRIMLKRLTKPNPTS